MNRDFSDIKKFFEEKQAARKKPVETEMYWWLNMNRPFFIGDEYKIVLEKIDSANKSVRIKIVNLKTNKQQEIVSQSDLDLQQLIALHDSSSDGE
jgi:hypothetical protein